MAATRSPCSSRPGPRWPWQARGQSWAHFESRIKDTLGDAIGAILILLLIGALAGTWLVSGIIPTLINVGLDVLSKDIFLPAACILCAAVSLATGSSWGTVGTVGVALIGIGQALGLSEGWTAGAIISGAYFGDKLSPLSDTTNLAPTVAGTDLFTHIRFMLWTTVPSILVALIVFTMAGLGAEGPADLGGAAELQSVLAHHFNLHWALFLVPVGVIVLIARKVAPVPHSSSGSSGAPWPPRWPSRTSSARWERMPLAPHSDSVTPTSAQPSPR